MDSYLHDQKLPIATPFSYEFRQESRNERTQRIVIDLGGNSNEPRGKVTIRMMDGVVTVAMSNHEGLLSTHKLFNLLEVQDA